MSLKPSQISLKVLQTKNFHYECFNPKPDNATHPLLMGNGETLVENDYGLDD